MAGQLGEEVAAIVGLGSLAMVALVGGSGTGTSIRNRTGLEAVTPTPRDTSRRNALAIRRVEQHDAGRLAGRHALQRITTPELDHARHACTFGIALRKVHHSERHIAAINRRSGFVFQVTGFFDQALPNVVLEGEQFLETKAPLQTRRDAAGDLRRFDRNGAAAAAGVVQRDGGVPATGGDHGRGQGFLQRRIAFVGAPTALEQRLARGVDVQREGFGRHVGINAHVGPGGVHIGTLTAFVAKAVGYRVFDFEGRKVQAGQWAVLRRDVDFESLLGREPDFPGHFAGGVVQVVFVAVIGDRQLDQHALGQAAVQVDAHRIAPRGAGHHAAAACHQVLARETGDGVHLVGQEALNASGARHEQVQ